MADALPGHLARGVPLPEPELAEASTLAGTLRPGATDAPVGRLTELAVHWVLANPDPLRLPPPAYPC